MQPNFCVYADGAHTTAFTRQQSPLDSAHAPNVSFRAHGQRSILEMERNAENQVYPGLDASFKIFLSFWACVYCTCLHFDSAQYISELSIAHSSHRLKGLYIWNSMNIIFSIKSNTVMLGKVYTEFSRVVLEK